MIDAQCFGGFYAPFFDMNVGAYNDLVILVWTVRWSRIVQGGQSQPGTFCVMREQLRPNSVGRTVEMPRQQKYDNRQFEDQSIQ